MWVSREKFVTLSPLPHTHSTLYSLTTGEPIATSPDSTFRFPLPDGVHSVTWDLRTGHAGWWLETPGKGDDEAPKQILSSDYCFRAAVSGSLRYVVYEQPGGELWRVSLPDGKRERLPSVFDGINPLMWSDIQFSLDDKSVVYGKTRLEAKLVLVENLFK